MVEGKIIENNLKPEPINAVSVKHSEPNSSRVDKNGSNSKPECMEKLFTGKRSEAKRCFNCGGEFPHKKLSPARGKQCDNCGRYNHFASCCRQKCRKMSHLRHAESTRKDLNECISRLQVNTNNAARDSSDDEFLFTLADNRQPRTKVNIRGVSMNMTIDTGASINVIDED